MASVFIGVIVPPEYGTRPGWWEYRDKLESKTKEFGWPDPEGCGPFEEDGIVKGFSLCYELDCTLDVLQDCMIKLRCEFTLEDEVTLNV